MRSCFVPEKERRPQMDGLKTVAFVMSKTRSCHDAFPYSNDTIPV